MVIMLDFAFSGVFVKNLAYAWSGAEEIKEKGISIRPRNESPNIHLFIVIFKTMKAVCFMLSVIILLVMVTLGSAYIIYISRGIANKSIFPAWLLYSLGVWANIYFNYWSLGLKGVGLYAGSQQSLAITKMLQLLLALTALTIWKNLIVLSASYLISGIVMGIVARKIFTRQQNMEHFFKDRLKSVSRAEIIKTFKILWFNQKSAGIAYIAHTVMIQSGTFFCSLFLGVTATALYGLCFQINNALCGVGQIFFQTNFAAITNARIRREKEKIQKLFSISMIVLWIVVIFGLALVLILGEVILSLIGSKISLQRNIFLLMGVWMLIFTTYHISVSYITIGNIYPFVNSLVLTSFVQIVIFLLLGLFSEHNIYMILIINMICLLSYISWKWTSECLKELGLTVPRLVRSGFFNVFEIIKSLMSGSKNNGYADL
jgi:O-antigen/teichoic acid export membrane protein